MMTRVEQAPLPELERWLRRAAAGGEAEARVALGRHLLRHQPQAAEEGLSLLLGATGECGEAAHLVALLTAAGVGLSQSWERALELVQHAAALGYPLAQAELACLQGNGFRLHAASCAEEPRHSASASPSQSIDLARWLCVPTFGILSRSPRIGVVPQFATPEVCDWLIERARARVEPAQIFDPASGVLRPDENRTNRETHFELLDSDLILLLTRSRIAAAIGIPTSGFELTAVLNYTRGQHYGQHVDYFDPALPGDAKHIAEGGQRVLTFLLYLNDTYTGGETAFPKLQIRHRGARGDALFFWNIEPSGAVDMRTLHAGLPPTDGEKWLLSQWIRARPS